MISPVSSPPGGLKSCSRSDRTSGLLALRSGRNIRQVGGCLPQPSECHPPGASEEWLCASLSSAFAVAAVRCLFLQQRVASADRVRPGQLIVDRKHDGRCFEFRNGGTSEEQ